MKPSLQLKLGQTLTMTPQLQQAIRLLQMPAMELQAHIREQLETNVMLEPVDEYEATGTFEALEPHPMPDEQRVDAQAQPEVTVEAEVVEDAWTERSAGSDSWRDDDERASEVADDVTLSLQDHLIGQLEYANLAPRDLAIARAIVDAINDDGYITDSVADIAATLLPEVTADADEVERVLKLVQTLDPAGVAARSLGECLQLQLRVLHPDTPGLRLALAIA
ncbi:MAG: RNA polymerase factor sigma-54, partial [Steroidobacteraceae bacterium]|nr:RNA polymerase factor sigma-54 [Steroidobacteraceae bacterium]